MAAATGPGTVGAATGAVETPLTSGNQQAKRWSGDAGGAERGIALPALFLGVRAAGGEPTALGRVDQVRWATGDGVEPHAARIGQARNRVHERPGVGHVGVVEQRAGGGPLHDAPGVHDHDVVGPVGHHPEVVGDQDDRHVALPLQVGQQIEDLGLHGDVEAGGGLVGHDQPGSAGQGDGDHHPLAHTARQLEWDTNGRALPARECPPTGGARWRWPPPPCGPC